MDSFDRQEEGFEGVPLPVRKYAFTLQLAMGALCPGSNAISIIQPHISGLIFCDLLPQQAAKQPLTSTSPNSAS